MDVLSRSPIKIQLSHRIPNRYEIETTASKYDDRGIASIGRRIVRHFLLRIRASALKLMKLKVDGHY